MAKRKGNKKNKRNKLLLLILLLSLSVLLLVMSTYAWFTSNRSVSVETLQVNVSTVNGLQISTDAVNWKARVLKNDITSAKYTGVKNILPNTLDHVSTIGTVDSATGLMQMYHGVVSADQTTGNYSLATTYIDESSRTQTCVGDTAVPDGTSAPAGVTLIPCNANGTQEQMYFVAFDLYFKVDATTTVVLDPTSGVDQILESGQTDTGIKNTVRVAFVKQGNVAPGGSAGTAQALHGGESVLIWEPNADTHTPSGLANASSVYGLDTSGTIPSSLTYEGVKAPFLSTAGVYINTANSTRFPAYFGSVTTYPTNYTNAANIPFATLAAGVTKYRVYWWVEGQDVDTENSATGTNMKLDLAFSIA